MIRLFTLLTLTILILPNHGFAKNQDTPSFSKNLWGTAPESVFYLGMWTYHFQDDGTANWNNHAYGIEHNGYFISTMKNTYYQQCYSIGIARHWVRKNLSKNFSIALGYRLGAIYGYDKQLKSIADFAETYKILPYGQLYTHIIYRRLRFEISYINQLISFHFSFIWKKY